MPADTGRILLVEDNLVARLTAVRVLDQQGHTVVEAYNGQEALTRLHAEPFDLVLLDVLMPELDGFETLARIKQDPNLRHLPVIMITAVDDMESVVRCIELGADDYLPKPFNPTLLQARLSASLEKKRLRDQEQLYLKGLEREFEIARDIQVGFLPDTLPSWPGWEIAAQLQPAREVAGDFYDVFELPEGRLGLVISDVCDKGVGAALFMTLFRSLIRAAANLTFYIGPNGLAAQSEASLLLNTITFTNNYIARTHGKANMFATMFFGVLNPATGLLSYINAGHESPLVLNAAELKAELKSTGPAVGLAPDLPFAVQEIQMAAGDVLFAYTDGLTDAKSPSGEFLGRDRLLTLLRQPTDSLHKLMKMLDSTLATHIADASQFDDITVLAVRRLSPEE
jgi:serine phosphatase RsbU (regulator of sigma subunit)